MAAGLQELRSRVARLEDLNAVRAAIIAFETTRDGPAKDAPKLAKYLVPQIRFHWTLEGIRIRGRGKLINYLREGMALRVWCRHCVTNIEVIVKGRKAVATWYVFAESIAQPNIKQLRKGSLRARQREPVTEQTIIRSSTKGGKAATLIKTGDVWRFSEYRTDMTRISLSHVKFVD